MENRHACFPITQNRGKEGGKHEKIPARQSQAGHTEPWLSCRHFRHSFGAAPFLRAGHIVGFPLGTAPLSRLPQRPYHERPVLRGHCAHFTDSLRAAVYRVLH